MNARKRKQVFTLAASLISARRNCCYAIAGVLNGREEVVAIDTLQSVYLKDAHKAYRERKSNFGYRLSSMAVGQHRHHWARAGLWWGFPSPEADLQREIALLLIAEMSDDELPPLQ